MAAASAFASAAQQEQAELADLFPFSVQCDPGDLPPDPSTLDPDKFTDWRRLAAQLQKGHAYDPSWFLQQLGPQQRARLAALSGNPSTAPSLRGRSAYEILTTKYPDPIWAVPGLLPAGLTILGGRAKIGKSWLCLQLMQAVCTGGRVLGQQVTAGPALYCALEDSPRRLQSRMTAQGWQPDPQGFGLFLDLEAFGEDIGPLNDPLAVAQLAAYIQEGGYRLCIVDTFSRAIRGDQNDMDTVTRALSPLQAAALAQSCAVVVVDHHRKVSGDNADPLLDVAGSVAKGAVADCSWGLYRERGKAGAVLAVTGRDVEEQRLQIHFDAFTCCWQLDALTGAPPVTGPRRKLLDAMEQLKGAAGASAIAKQAGEDRSNSYKLLNEMANDGLIIRQGAGKGVLFSLKSSSGEEEEEDAIF